MELCASVSHGTGPAQQCLDGGGEAAELQLVVAAAGERQPEVNMAAVANRVTLPMVAFCKSLRKPVFAILIAFIALTICLKMY